MKIGLHVVLISTLILALATVTGVSLSREAVARDATSDEPDRKTEIIMMRCSLGGSTFRTTLFEGSSAAPAKRTENCPENLSLLLRDGFEILHVAVSDQDKDFSVYTLVR